VAALAEMYVQGVSTRKVKAIWVKSGHVAREPQLPTAG
jgi:transposase-like protein